ncbi:MAG: M55 family metallopeptidase [Chloroflexi bacterium]|nr:M55 family metallopeptidase [Chloroflexota bacterium]
MKIMVMTDMEGVAGLMDSDNWCHPPSEGHPGRYYELGKQLLTEEVNAAVDGLCDAGADDLVVADGHGAGGINPLLLDRRCKLMRGWPEKWPFGLDASYDAVVWVGQHAKACTTYAHLAHTQSMRYIDLSINGVSIGEFGQLALCAGELGIPALFGAGDEAFYREAQALAPGIVTAAVKQGRQFRDGRELDLLAYAHHNLAAVHLHHSVACEAIRVQARSALSQFVAAGRRAPIVKLQPPYERVTLLRPEKPGDPVLIDRATHPSSVIALMNLPMNPQPVTDTGALSQR